jgi:endonuclease/exonuclease/phosphatase family metal-dependent hydrolase
MEKRMPIPFSVMTWNVENLFLPGHEPGPETAAIFDQKLRNLAATISAVAPDVIALQEVGDLAAFAALQERLGDRYPHAHLSAHSDRRGIRVGFVSRLPLKSAEDLVDVPAEALRDVPAGEGQPITRLGRGALKVNVDVAPGLSVTLITAHLKSKLLTYPNNRRSPRNEDERARAIGGALIRRTVEAVVLRVYINKLVANTQQPLIVLGDLNDGPEAVTTQILLGPEEHSLAHPDKGDDVRLYNLVPYLPAERRFSRIYRKQRELIDHILVSHELIFHRQQIDSVTELIDSIDHQLGPRRRAVFPDHAPVFARFALPSIDNSTS